MQQVNSILITGGTGTLGQSLLDNLHFLPQLPSYICIYSRDEIKQIEQEISLRKKFPTVVFNWKIGDVRDLDRLVECCKGIDVIVHAAAMKHIVVAERNPEECYKTNVLGTENVLKAAQITAVKKVVFISSDKAVEPVNIYGRSKKAGELLCNQNPNTSVLRLGNIFGSRGSVLPLIQKKKATKEAFELTNPEATRFLVTPNQAAELVWQTVSSFHFGLFVPVLPSIQIVDLVKALAPELKIVQKERSVSEKLYEQLLTIEEFEQMDTHQLHIISSNENQFCEYCFFQSNTLEIRLKIDQIKQAIQDL